MSFSPEIFSPEILLLLTGVATFAGFIDAIAGSGGLLLLPVLLWTGLTLAQALATNKLQAVSGSFSATIHFIRRRTIDLRSMFRAIVFAFIGAACGTICIQLIDPTALEKLIPILLISFALYFLFSPCIGDKDAKPGISLDLFSFTIPFIIGFYDGFFGPGTGSFFAIAFVMLLGYNLIKATAHAKLLNFTSNLAALIFFVIGGQVVWKVGLVMAVGQFIGGYLGAHMVLRHGSSLIRPLLVFISLSITLKLLLFND